MVHVTVMCIAHGRDMHYTYLVSATLWCSGIVPFCRVCGQAVWYVAFLTVHISSCERGVYSAPIVPRTITEYYDGGFVYSNYRVDLNTNCSDFPDLLAVHLLVILSIGRYQYW
jgi:hypothetical protein